MSIVDERLAMKYEEGAGPAVFWLNENEGFRLSELERLSKSIEQLCEYILFLEDKIKSIKQLCEYILFIEDKSKSIEQLCEYILFLEDKIKGDFDSLPALCATCGKVKSLHSIDEIMECAKPKTIMEQMLKEWGKC